MKICVVLVEKVSVVKAVVISCSCFVFISFDCQQSAGIPEVPCGITRGKVVSSHRL